MRRLAAAAVALWASGAVAVPKAGEWVQADNLGMNLYSYDYVARTAKTVADRADLSEFVGAHYFFADGWRVGVMFQASERLAPAPPAGESRFRTFAVLPQVGWHFYGPMFAALIVTIAPFIDGKPTFTFGGQFLLGAGVQVAKSVKLTAALEIPVNFVGKTTIGITPLLGASFVL
jgi:hypothetical protein